MSATSISSKNVFVIAVACFYTLSANLPCLAAPAGLPMPMQRHLRFAGPYTYRNLAIYFIRGKQSGNGQQLLTLQEALKNRSVVINETGNVNQLTIQNRGKLPVFVQGGDIVRGGRQDRTIRDDMVLPPKSGIVPVNVFCVENGRWQARGNEDARLFSDSSNELPSKELKLAAKVTGDQGLVWQRVDELQRKAAKAGHVGIDRIRPNSSPTSLDLTMNNKPVESMSFQYKARLAPTLQGKNDIVGYACVINGTVSSVDVYSSPQLFKKLWPKLIDASAVEAATKLVDGKSYPPVKTSSIESWMDDAKRAHVSSTRTVANTKVEVHESAQHVLITSAGTAAIQGATNGTVGPQGYDATVITGVNTSGAVRRNSPDWEFFHFNFLSK
jgi:hypothetical protein